MKAKFKAWVRAHSHCFGLSSYPTLFMEYGVNYGADGYEREPSPPTPAGWYTFTVFDDECEDTYAYFSDPDSYMEYLCDCGMSVMMSGSCRNTDCS